MEKGDGPPTSTTDTSSGPPGYPGNQYPSTLPDGYYPTGGPPPAYPGTQPYPAAQPYPGAQPYPAGQGYPQSYPATQGYTGQTTQSVVVQQPNVVIMGHAGVPPPDYQALAWFACLCCCWPLGLVAIIRSNEVRAAAARGDYASADAASRSARTMSFLAIGLGIAFMVLYVIILVVYLIPLLSMQRDYNSYN